MNPKIRLLNKSVIDKRKAIIIDRGELLDFMENCKTLPRFIMDPFEEIVIAFVLGLDVSLGKLIPIFIEKMLIDICVSVKAGYSENIPKTRKEIEEKSAKSIFEEVRSCKIFIEKDLVYLESIYDNKNSINRNYEIHNKEITKLKKQRLVGVNEETGAQRDLDPFMKKMLYENTDMA